VMRFTVHPENLATEALAFVLSRSAKAQGALVNLIAQLGVTLPAGLIIRTQAGGDDGARPDLVGLAGADQPLLIEAKFWAGLTEKQPVSYVKRLPATGGMLLFIAPAARLSLVWEELLRRCASGGLQPAEKASSMPGCFVAAVAGQQTMAIVSWRALLGVLKAPLSDLTDAPIREDIGQLEGLCDRQDADAFLPVTHEELSTHIYRRILQFYEMVDPIVDLLLARKIVSQPKVSRDKAIGYWGRWVQAQGHWLLFSCNIRKWMAYASTPFWLTIADVDYLDPPPQATMAVLNGLQSERPPRMFMGQDGRPAVPLFVPPGLERDAVMEAIVEQVQALVVSFPPIAGGTPGAPPAGAPGAAAPGPAPGPGTAATPSPGPVGAPVQAPDDDDA
jgi:hypothetical protein